MIKIPFTYKSKLGFEMPLLLGEKLPLRMLYRDKLRMMMPMTPFTEHRNLDEPNTLVMVLIHEKLAFGVDRFLLGQLDALTLGTIDPFPLDVK